MLCCAVKQLRAVPLLQAILRGFGKMKSFLRVVASGLGAAVVLVGSGGVGAASPEPIGAGEVVATSSGKIRIVQYPKRVRIGNTPGSTCAKKVKVKVFEDSALAGKAMDLIYAAYVVDSPVPISAQRIRNVKPGKTYTLFPYPAPEYGQGYKVTLCGTLASQLVALPSPSRQVGTLSVDLVPSGEGANNPYATRTKSIKVDWRGQSG